MRVNKMIVDDTTKMNVRWKSGSQVKRVEDVTSNIITNIMSITILAYNKIVFTAKNYKT